MGICNGKVVASETIRSSDKSSGTTAEPVQSAGPLQHGLGICNVDATASKAIHIFGESGRDCMMISYVANVTKIQLQLAEKLNTASFLV